MACFGSVRLRYSGGQPLAGLRYHCMLDANAANAACFAPISPRPALLWAAGVVAFLTVALLPLPNVHITLSTG